MGSCDVAGRMGNGWMRRVRIGSCTSYNRLRRGVPLALPPLSLLPLPAFLLVLRQGYSYSCG